MRRYLGQRKREMGFIRQETFVPQSYAWGQEAQIDWYEAVAELDGERQKLQVFCMRRMGSGGAFHRAYPRATQQAFLEAHELGFRYFAGVFGLLRYDNLTSAVKKILRGYRREETERFIAFRSHWKFQAEFCTPGEGHEKGGVEGEAGYFRRNHLVPVPKARDLADLNAQLLAGCRADEGRKIGGRVQTVGEGMQIEHPHLLALSREGFSLAEDSFPRVDGKGCVRVRRPGWGPLRRVRSEWPKGRSLCPLALGGRTAAVTGHGGGEGFRPVPRLIRSAEPRAVVPSASC